MTAFGECKHFFALVESPMTFPHLFARLRLVRQRRLNVGLYALHPKQEGNRRDTHKEGPHLVHPGFAIVPVADVGHSAVHGCTQSNRRDAAWGNIELFRTLWLSMRVRSSRPLGPMLSNSLTPYQHPSLIGTPSIFSSYSVRIHTCTRC